MRMSGLVVKRALISLEYDGNFGSKVAASSSGVARVRAVEGLGVAMVLYCVDLTLVLEVCDGNVSFMEEVTGRI